MFRVLPQVLSILGFVCVMVCGAALLLCFVVCHLLLRVFRGSLSGFRLTVVGLGRATRFWVQCLALAITHSSFLDCHFW